jgi:hypothetical protein
VLDIREKRFCFKKEECEEKKERKSSHEMIGQNTQKFEIQLNILAWENVWKVCSQFPRSLKLARIKEKRKPKRKGV